MVSMLVSELSGLGWSPWLGALLSVLCSWARHFTLTVPLSPPRCTEKFNAWGSPAMD